MNKIILPTDFSENAFNAIKYAVSFFEGEPCEFIIYHTHELPLDAAELQPSVREKIEQRSKDELEKTINKIHELDPDKNHSFSTFAEYSYSAEGIVKLAQSENADAIVMGTQGASGLKEIFVGSVAADVIQGATCPVIAIPRDVEYHRPKKIVFATDLDPLSNYEILEPLIETVRHFDTHLMVLHIFKKGRFMKQEVKMNENSLLQDEFANIKDSFHYVENNNTTEGIQRFIEEHDADMLAMITRDHGFFKSIFHQSSVEQMAFHSKIPLLALHN